MSMNPLSRLLLLFVFATGIAHAAEMPGLKVGDVAPDFTLASGTGEDVSLADLRANGPVVLVFVRSADWCPYCKRQLQELEANRAAIEATGAQLVGLSYDNVATQTKAVAQLGLTYPLLSDAGSKTIEAFGILKKDGRGKADGLPYPAIFVVDSDGVIKAKLMEEKYQDRPSQAVLDAALAGL